MAETRFLNGCVWTPTATGTGTWTVSTAVAPYFTPAGCTNPVVVTGGTYNYFAINGTEYEIGQGVYTAAGTTLTRATVKSSSNGGAVVNFSSAPTVYMGGPLAYDVTSVHITQNYGLAFSVATNALTCALKTVAGTDPSGSDKVTVLFRGTPVTNGVPSKVEVSSALSLVIPSGATMGHTSALIGGLFWYAINNAGAVELAVAGSFFGNEGIVSTTTIADTADSATVMYSTTGRSNVAYEFLGMSGDTQTTAGTWASNISHVRLGRYEAKPTMRIGFTSSGTHTQPSDCWFADADVIGGGGGGSTTLTEYGGSGGGRSKKSRIFLPPGATVSVTVAAASSASGAGNSSSFGSYNSATGGAAGSSAPGAGGSGSGGDVNFTGTQGGIGGGTFYGGGGGPWGMAGSPQGTSESNGQANTGRGGVAGAASTGGSGFVEVLSY